MDRQLMSLLEELEPFFGKEGYVFRKRDRVFVKSNEAGSVCGISVDLLKSSHPGRSKVALHAHIRIAEIESVYAKYNPYLTPSELKEHFTVNVNCDNLFSDVALTAAVELDGTSLTVAARNIWGAIYADVLPLLEKYCERDLLVRNLESPEPAERIVSDPIARFSILISDAALENDEDRFRGYKDQFLRLFKKPHARVYLPAIEEIAAGVEGEFFRL